MTVREHIANVFNRKLNMEKVIGKKELALFAGVEPSAVTKWIKGTAVPNVESIPIICEKLEITIQEFFGIAGINELSAEDKAILNKVKANPSLFEVVKNYKV